MATVHAAFDAAGNRHPLGVNDVSPRMKTRKFRSDLMSVLRQPRCPIGRLSARISTFFLICADAEAVVKTSANLVETMIAKWRSVPTLCVDPAAVQPGFRQRPLP